VVGEGTASLSGGVDTGTVKHIYSTLHRCEDFSWGVDAVGISR
jgi:hypothetical protein